MLLREIISVHEAYEDETPLTTVLGDGYLYANNQVVRGTRDALLFLGYELSLNPFLQLQSVPFMVLPEILKTRMVPYQDTMSSLKEIERMRPGKFHFAEVELTTRCHHLHESGHCIAEEVLPNDIAPVGGISEMQLKALRLLTAEAYAVCVELMAYLLSNSNMHEFLLGQNSYVNVNSQHPENRQRFAPARECLLINGFSFTAKLLYFSVLNGLCLKEPLDARGLLRILNLIAPGAKLEKSESDFLLSVARTTGQKSPSRTSFVYGTNYFYFRYVLGLEHDLAAFLNFDYLVPFDRDATKWRNRLDLLMELAEFGVRGPLAQVLVRQSAVAPDDALNGALAKPENPAA